MPGLARLPAAASDAGGHAPLALPQQAGLRIGARRYGDFERALQSARERDGLRFDALPRRRIEQVARHLADEAGSGVAAGVGLGIGVGKGVAADVGEGAAVAWAAAGVGGGTVGTGVGTYRSWGWRFLMYVRTRSTRYSARSRKLGVNSTRLAPTMSATTSTAAIICPRTTARWSLDQPSQSAGPCW